MVTLPPRNKSGRRPWGSLNTPELRRLAKKVDNETYRNKRKLLPGERPITGSTRFERQAIAKRNYRVRQAAKGKLKARLSPLTKADRALLASRGLLPRKKSWFEKLAERFWGWGLS